MPDRQTQLACHDLCLGYDSRVVVSGLNFAVSAGDYLVIIGENGSGKSTLMKTLLNLKAPLSGQVVLGDDLARGEMGYLPQQTIIQKDFPASVREVVRSGCLNRSGLRPFYSKAERQLAEESMQRLGITHLAKRCYRELSGGQQQRTLIARALCATRKILLLDEPAAGLDTKASHDLYDALLELNASGITIIMISHDITCAVEYASHVLHLSATTTPDGQPAHFFGTREEYLQSEVAHTHDELESGQP